MECSEGTVESFFDIFLILISFLELFVIFLEASDDGAIDTVMALALEIRVSES